MLISSIFNISFINQALISLLIAFVIVFISYRLKFLTLSGSIATFFLAGIIFTLGGIKWSIPILTFFILSSLISKLRKKKNDEVELFFEKSGTRDYFQVLANGGLGGVLVILYFLYDSDFYYLLYLASLSAVCADTWATELGTWNKTKTYNILTFKEVEQGVSGGISFIGTLGAIAGTVAISFSGIYWIEMNYAFYFILIIVSGLFGSFIDSILGATIQLQKECSVCNKITERNFHCGEETKFYRGISFINNDVVNFIAGLSGTILIIILLNI
ncbi:MAG: DUF92 domain-containing protein [Melioribacteraceae bacterium]|nr:DUF92 domain-containing protein [Melioribacteraceae bacterium]